MARKAKDTTAEMENAQDVQAVAAAEVDAIKASYGENVLVEVGDKKLAEPVSTGLMYLDWATVIGGICKGGITVLYGPRSCGKSHLAKHVTAQFQKTLGTPSVWVISEGEFDTPRAHLLGMDLNATIRIHTNELETALDVVRGYVRKGGFNPIVIDSISNLSPRSVMEQEHVGDKEAVGIFSKRTASVLRQLSTECLRHGTSIIMISHVLNSPDPYQKRYQFHGGNTVEHNALLIAEMAPMGYLDKNLGEARIRDETVGKKVGLLVYKNKRGPEGRQAVLHLMWDSGFDVVADRILFAEHIGALRKAGSWLSIVGEGGELLEYEGSPLRWQGRAAAIHDLKENLGKFVFLEGYLKETLAAR